MALLGYKLPAHSIVEAMVAMMIIMLSFGIGMSIYLNILTAERTIAKTNVNVILNDLLEQTKLEDSFIDETTKSRIGIIEKSITKYNENESTYLLELKFYDHQKSLIHELREILYLPVKE